MYKLVPNFSLKDNNSFHLDVRASYWLSVSSGGEWLEAMERYQHIREEKRLIIGSGTNLLFLDDFDGLVISPDIHFLRVVREDDDTVELEAGAGVEWDEVAELCAQKGWYGTENLSLIPGKTGAAPFQNIGAYGVEVSEVVSRVSGIHLDTGRTGEFETGSCRFGYRTSLFKEELANRFLITSVFLRLEKKGRLTTAYGDVSKTLAQFGDPTPANMRRAVVQIRQSKLPDPKKLGNAGSFFKNPVVNQKVVTKLIEILPGLPVYPQEDGRQKLSAAYLIDQAGWKGRRTGKAAVHDQQALVIVNTGGATGWEIMQLANNIREDILEKYGVTLEPEVQVIGQDHP